MFKKIVVSIFISFIKFRLFSPKFIKKRTSNKIMRVIFICLAEITEIIPIHFPLKRKILFGKINLNSFHLNIFSNLKVKKYILLVFVFLGNDK
jgi:hypothetical protein